MRRARWMDRLQPTPQLPVALRAPQVQAAEACEGLIAIADIPITATAKALLIFDIFKSPVFVLSMSRTLPRAGGSICEGANTRPKAAGRERRGGEQRTALRR